MAGDYYLAKISGRFNASAADTGGSGVSATQAAPSAADDRYDVTGIQCSGDAATLVTIESPSGTVIWRKRFAAAFTMSEQFAPGTVQGAPGQAILVKVGSEVTTNSEANIQGFRI